MVQLKKKHDDVPGGKKEEYSLINSKGKAQLFHKYDEGADGRIPRVAGQLDHLRGGPAVQTGVQDPFPGRPGLSVLGGLCMACVHGSPPGGRTRTLDSVGGGTPWVG